MDRKIRGRTKPQRLQALDRFLVLRERTLLERPDASLVVDLGFGEQPWTTLELARAVHSVNPALCVLGVEREPHRVEQARVHATPQVSFREGTFHLPLPPGEGVRVLRVMNLLRGYKAEHVPAIHHLLGTALVPGGLLLEGSTDTPGAVTVAHLLRRREAGLAREALLFHTDFSRGFGPLLFRDWLPRDLRRRVKPGEAIHGFFSAWVAAWEEARAAGFREPRAAFRESVPRLAARGVQVDPDPVLSDAGYLLWIPGEGVPA